MEEDLSGKAIGPVMKKVLVPRVHPKEVVLNAAVPIINRTVQKAEENELTEQEEKRLAERKRQKVLVLTLEEEMKTMTVIQFILDTTATLLIMRKDGKRL